MADRLPPIGQPLPPSVQATIDANKAEEEEARRRAVGTDMLKSAGSGLANAVAGAPGAPTDLVNSLQSGWLYLQEKMYGPEHRKKLEEQIAREAQVQQQQAGEAGYAVPQVVKETAKSVLPKSLYDAVSNPWPSGEEFKQSVRDIHPLARQALDYPPATTAGKAIKGGAEIVGGAIMPAGVGGARQVGTVPEKLVAFVKELFAQGLAPAAVSELTGLTLEQLAPAYAETGRFLGAVAGGSVAGGGKRTATMTDMPELGPLRTKAVERAGEGVADVGGTGNALAEMHRVGPEATLADVGPRLAGQTEGLLRKPGPQQQVVRDWLTQRQQAMRGENSQLNQALDTHLEPRDPNFGDRVAAMEEARTKRGNELYGQARQMVGDAPVAADRARAYTDSIVPKNVEDMQSLTKGEERLVRLQKQVAGRSNYDDLFNLQSELGREIKQLQRSNPDTINIDALAKTRDFLNESLDKATTRPDGTSLNRAARTAYREDSGILDAVEDGAGIFDRNERPDLFAKRWREMSDDQRTAFRMGARDSLDQKLGPATDSQQFNAGMSALSSDWGRQKLNIMLGQEAATAFIDRVEGLARQRKTTGDIAGGSQTASRTEGMKEIPDVVAPAKAPSMATEAPGFGQVITGTLKKLYEKVAPNLSRATNAAENVSHARLNTYNIQNRADFMRQLDEVYQARGQRRVPLGTAPAVGGINVLREDEEKR